MGNKKLLILLVLCFGYFIDFYDLTVLSVCYVDLFKNQFGLTDNTIIQQTYYLVNNVQMGGILIGAILFGSLADKYGRMTVIKYSILLYSIMTLLSIVTTNFSMFLVFRFFAYLALASEFGVSTVMIIELFPRKIASWGMSLLYILGVLGGIVATFIGSISWKYMFIVGGTAGLLIFICRSILEESPEFIRMHQKYDQKESGSIKYMLKEYSKPLWLNFLITLPYFVIITVMFAMVKFIVSADNFASAIQLFLFGFFAGNIISCILSGIYSQYFNSPKLFFVINLILFLIICFGYSFVSENQILLFGCIVGCIGGGYNIMWAQYATREFPTKIRALATNSIFALGRTSTILFAMIFSYAMTTEQIFQLTLYSLTIIVFVIVVSVVIFYTRKPILEG